MLKKLSHQQAQSITEYAILLGLVALVITGVSLYLQRALQARIFDAKRGVHNVVGPWYTLTQGGGNTPAFIPLEYEPYYTQSNTERDTRTEETGRLGRSSIFRKEFDNISTSKGRSDQLPPTSPPEESSTMPPPGPDPIGPPTP